jgi:hypothetical protein
MALGEIKFLSPGKIEMSRCDYGDHFAVERNGYSRFQTNHGVKAKPLRGAPKAPLTP